MKITKEYLKQNGGATLTPKGQIAQGLKFVASQFGNEIKANLNAIDDYYLSETIKAYKQTAKKFGAFIGLWVNENDVYIDVSFNFNDKDKALSFAKSNKQLAIFDAINKECITV